MTQKQKNHVEDLLAVFKDRLAEKYQKGAEEHGGNLWDMSAEQLLDEAINECIDQYTYLMTLKEKLEKLTSS